MHKLKRTGVDCNNFILKARKQKGKWQLTEHLGKGKPHTSSGKSYEAMWCMSQNLQRAQALGTEVKGEARTGRLLVSLLQKHGCRPSPKSRC